MTPAHADPGSWTLVTAPRIHTLAGPPVEALAVLGERVVATGTAAELGGRFSFDQRVELDGVVVPGLTTPTRIPP
jgi:predicted amidohydrolase YtcJ